MLTRRIKKPCTSNTYSSHNCSASQHPTFTYYQRASRILFPARRARAHLQPGATCCCCCRSRRGNFRRPRIMGLNGPDARTRESRSNGRAKNGPEMGSRTKFLILRLRRVHGARERERGQVVLVLLKSLGGGIIIRRRGMVGAFFRSAALSSLVNVRLRVLKYCQSCFLYFFLCKHTLFLFLCLSSLLNGM